MTNALSKLNDALETWSFKYNCYEAVHPWTPYCTYSALDIGLTVFVQAFKLYTPLYLVSQASSYKYDVDSFKLTAISILRSASFISGNTIFTLLLFCSSQYVTGKFYYHAVAYIPALIGSMMAILIEKPRRRASLAFYVANVASETLFRVYVARGYIKPLNNGQVYIFTLAISIIMLLAKKNGFENDPLSMAIKVIVGSEEAGNRRSKRELNAGKLLNNLDKSTVEEEKKLVLVRPHQEKNINSDTQHEDRRNFQTRLTTTLDWLKRIFHDRHRLCPHETSSCFSYSLKAAIRALGIGYGALLGVKVVTKLPKILDDPKMLYQIPTEPGVVRMGLFLSSFSFMFKVTNCLLRWHLDASNPTSCFIAGLVAGPTLLINPSPTIALYVLWKSIETMFNEAVDKGIIKNRNASMVILYGIATSQLFHTAVLEPQYMKKSYMSFLDRMSHHKLHMINRSVLDIFGTQASAGYEEYFPDLHPGFMSKAFLGSFWVWLLDNKISAKKVATSI